VKLWESIRATRAYQYYEVRMLDCGLTERDMEKLSEVPREPRSRRRRSAMKTTIVLPRRPPEVYGQIVQRALLRRKTGTQRSQDAHVIGQRCGASFAKPKR
jgi:hypothetical protein